MITIYDRAAMAHVLTLDLDPQLRSPKKIQGVYRWYVPWDRTQPSAKDLYVNRRADPENEEY